MKIGIMQPYLFPYIGYWQLINAVDIFVIYDDVNFIKQSFINRNNILLDNKKFMFSLQTIGASSNKLINQVKVGNNQKKLLKTFYQAYKKAPFFENIYPLIEKILNNFEEELSKYIGYSIFEISKYLDIDTKIIYSSNLDKNNSLKGQNKVIEIVKKLKGNMYINSIGGIELYKKEDFAREGIELKFLKSKEIKYKQFKNDFVPNLSIIDVLMFNDKETVKKYLERYDLI